MVNMYGITNRTSGADLGGYAADDEQGALDAMARDAGYDDFAASCAAIGVPVDDARRDLDVRILY